MSDKKSIEQRVKDLSEKEEKIKKQLDTDSDDMKEKIMRVGKITLIAGGVAILGYWLFNIFSQQEEIDEEDESKKKKKRKKYSSNSTSRITAILLPYLNNFLDGILEQEEEKKEKRNGDESPKDED